MPGESSIGTDPVDTDQLLDLGRRGGLAAVGVTPAQVLEPAFSVLQLRKQAGLAGEMQFTYRNPARSCDPTRMLPGARSIIAAAWAYGHWRPAGSESGTESAVAAVARYAWHDHYDDLRQALKPMADQLIDSGHRALIVADTNALVDRNVAWSAGLGWYGKNSNLLLPEAGSWYVLGAIVTDAELQPTGPPMEDGCGSCNQCIDDCPTAAIIAPGMVDATRCLAWIVQAGGSIPVEYREAIGDRLYGCDDCQDVCPPNRSADRSRHNSDAASNSEPSSSEASNSEAAGSSVAVAEQPVAEVDQVFVDLDWILTAEDHEIEARHGRWYIADRNIDVIRRTALVVLGNVGTPQTPRIERLLMMYLNSEVAILREHAIWAALRLGRPDLVDSPGDGLEVSKANTAVSARFSSADWAEQ
ncbi:MAG: tRNA epoxyqueuosine(34) reductase QueG [Acidimicrobiales bacterium]